ncbi:MAG: ABC transporter permease [Chloroflexota bacterium]|nr:ABC transporter permease [Chloroflexota bacterium]
MLSYILRRVLNMIPTLIIISIIGFVIIKLPAGDYLSYYIAHMEAQGFTGVEDVVQHLKQRYGLDQPAWKQYFIWITNFVQGDFGESFAYRKPVRELIGQRLMLTVTLSISTLILTWAIAIPIGIYSATHQYSLSDNIFTVIGFIGLAMPNFLLALVLLVISAMQFGKVPSGLFSPAFEEAPWSFAKVLDMLSHMWIPVIVIGTAGTASLIRIMRGNLLDILNQPYVQTARTKGLKERVVILKHAVPLALHPLIMQLGMTLPSIISGAAITSIVLSLPTAGPLYLTALQEEDMYLAGSFLVLISLLLVIGNLLADIALALMDPRIRYE